MKGLKKWKILKSQLNSSLVYDIRIVACKIHNMPRLDKSKN